MAERDGRLRNDVDRDVSVDVPEEGVEVRDGRGAERRSAGRERSVTDRIGARVRGGVGRVASGRGVAVSLVAVAASALVAGRVLPFGVVGDVAGIALGAFLYGTLSGTRRYVEVTLAGAVVGAILGVLGNLVLAVATLGVPVAATGAGTGALAAVVGHYFGRDLRDGLTRDL
jgi:hypothetical protein